MTFHFIATHSKGMDEIFKLEVDSDAEEYIPTKLELEQFANSLFMKRNRAYNDSITNIVCVDDSNNEMCSLQYSNSELIN